ncbi:bifunctional YncE family protein/alkaline phosphatase family protein [Streptomyces gamaensis]|uniref:Bifunctional YncE family protein/alkaline phosphatase family protein n=1 Tax=Streptomyces gamaensis TaxID=1763542 RepID=A0ABW0YW30_9ACTN
MRRRRRSGITVAALAATAALVSTAAATGATGGPHGGFGKEKVTGQETPRGILLPSNQRITPFGSRYRVDEGRLLSSALSPDGSRVAALTWKSFTGYLTVFDARTGKVVQRVGTGSGKDRRIGDGSAGTDGPYWSPDGRTLWFPQASDIVRFTVGADGKVSAPRVIPLTGPHGAALPGGMALAPDGSRLYVALNGSNTLGVIDTATDRLVQEIPVGNAPRQVVLDGGHAYVSNEGGRPARPGDFTNLSDGTPLVADRTTGAATTGTVSVVDLALGKETGTIGVGLHPTALYRDGSSLLVANSNGDSVSVVDTRSRRVTQTFNTNPLPGSRTGSAPNGITMPDAHHVLVSLGRDNAVAQYRWDGPRTPVRYEGLIPTDWYPVGVQYDAALGRVVVTNARGIGSRGPLSTVHDGPDTPPATGHNTYDDTGTLTVFAPPSRWRLGRLTHQVFVDNDWEKLLAGGDRADLLARPRPVPAHLGEPSAIEHVFLIVKENRTYDQVLGDMGKGDGDPSLAQFGRRVTPNQHALAERFGLFDNFYDEATLSADGHNWLMQADANDYIEKEFGAFYRSYPSQGADALAYQRTGFLWDAARRAGRSVENHGEYVNLQLPSSGAPSWSDWYRTSRILEGKESGRLPVPTGKYPSTSDIPSLTAVTKPEFPTFDTDIPDQYRVDIWLQHFREAERTGRLPALTLMTLPQDHTAGTSGKDPYPTAMVADNDLALGRLVDALSHSRFWKSSAVFVVEDDTQDGVDHVDGHRGPLWIASPYARRGAVISTYYSQLNVVRTIEQILGIQPMNQLDRAAEPMFDAFTDRPDLTPYSALPNQVPLDYGLKKPGVSPGQRGVPHGMERLAELWERWSERQSTGGTEPELDRVDPARMNRVTWYEATGWRRPYPGDTRVLAPEEVPGGRDGAERDRD